MYTKSCMTKLMKKLPVLFTIDWLIPRPPALTNMTTCLKQWIVRNKDDLLEVRITLSWFPKAGDKAIDRWTDLPIHECSRVRS